MLPRLHEGNHVFFFFFFGLLLYSPNLGPYKQAWTEKINKHVTFDLIGQLTDIVPDRLPLYLPTYLRQRQLVSLLFTRVKCVDLTLRTFIIFIIFFFGKHHFHNLLP